MAHFFNHSEIARMAMRVEEHGVDFYSYLADYNQKLSRLFIYLSKQESAHRVLFEQLADQVMDETDQKEYPVDLKAVLEESIDGLKQTADSMKRLGGQVPLQDVDVKRVFSIAIEAEEQTIDVYQQLQDSFSDEAAGILSKIIKDEHKHRNILLKYKKEIGI